MPGLLLLLLRVKPIILYDPFDGIHNARYTEFYVTDARARACLRALLNYNYVNFFEKLWVYIY